MEFFIKKGSQSPILKMKVIKDGRYDSYKIFNEELENATIRFSMKNESNGVQVIIMNNGFITERFQNNPDAPKEYYICYKWNGRETSRKGRYIGEFHIVNSMGELIAPIAENLYINIV